MLVRGADEIVGLYILNYSLLLLWGIASVLVEALFGARHNFTSYFSAFFALAIGGVCAIVHILIPVERRRRGIETEVDEEVRTQDFSGTPGHVSIHLLEHCLLSMSVRQVDQGSRYSCKLWMNTVLCATTTPVGPKDG